MLLLAHNWWSLAVRGVLAVLLGIVTFLWPGITLSALVLMFGVYAFLDGVLNLAGAWRRSQHHERWVAPLIEGVVGIMAGVVAFLSPGFTAVALVTVIAIWAIFTGILEIAAAFRLRRHIANEWLLGLMGVASVLFGVALFAAPITGALVLAVWFGVYALIFGIATLALAFRLRHWKTRNQSSFSAAASA